MEYLKKAHLGQYQVRFLRAIGTEISNVLSSAPRGYLIYV
jgi:hypothetical protein